MLKSRTQQCSSLFGNLKIYQHSLNSKHFFQLRSNPVNPLQQQLPSCFANYSSTDVIIFLFDENLQHHSETFSLHEKCRWGLHMVNALGSQSIQTTNVVFMQFVLRNNAQDNPVFATLLSKYNFMTISKHSMSSLR